MSKIIIFTDGSSRGNPGPGGWGAIIVRSEKLKVKSDPPSLLENSELRRAGKTQGGDFIVTELGGGEKITTNNRMELMAAIGGISCVSEDGEITVYSDSTYIIKGITEWIHGWKRNGWRTKAKDDVLNKDLWMKLDECAKNKDIKWKYIKGHAGITGNERCDQIATGFADGEAVKLYKGAMKGYEFKDVLKV
ncbi:MAG: ribonuclease H [Nanoarchaeota archaeon]|nr:ribonuclease H [Nanoarchaeota archaeon]